MVSLQLNNKIFILQLYYSIYYNKIKLAVSLYRHTFFFHPNWSEPVNSINVGYFVIFVWCYQYWGPSKGFHPAAAVGSQVMGLNCNSLCSAERPGQARPAVLCVHGSTHVCRMYDDHIDCRQTQALIPSGHCDQWCFAIAWQMAV